MSCPACSSDRIVIPVASIMLRHRDDDSLLICHDTVCQDCGQLVEQIRQPYDGVAPVELVEAFYDSSNPPDVHLWLFGRVAWHYNPLHMGVFDLPGMGSGGVELLRRGFRYEATLHEDYR